ncbi:uncharacterized protein RBU33_025252 [Hipposideros larvatus]
MPQPRKNLVQIAPHLLGLLRLEASCSQDRKADCEASRPLIGDKCDNTVPILRLSTSLRTPPDLSRGAGATGFCPGPPPAPPPHPGLAAGSRRGANARAPPAGQRRRSPRAAPGRARLPGFSAPPTSWPSQRAHAPGAACFSKGDLPAAEEWRAGAEGIEAGAVRDAAASPLHGPCPPQVGRSAPASSPVLAVQPPLVPAAARLVPRPRAPELEEPHCALGGAGPPHLVQARLCRAASWAVWRGERLGAVCVCECGRGRVCGAVSYLSLEKRKAD